MDIAAKVKEIVSDKLDVDGADIEEGQDFIEDLKADSLAVVEVVLALEEQFEIEIPDEDTEKIKTVRDAIEYVIWSGRRRCAHRGAATCCSVFPMLTLRSALSATMFTWPATRAGRRCWPWNRDRTGGREICPVFATWQQMTPICT